MTDLWDKLSENQKTTRERSILSLFEDPSRVEKYSAECDGMYLDISKTNIDDEARGLLIELIETAGLADKRAEMFSGARINSTEDRAVLHTALRANPDEADIVVDDENVLPDVTKTLQRMADFSRAIRSGEITAQDGQPFSDVVNIGIGGSDLGPAMATLALAPYHDGPRCHFVSNIDGAHIADTLRHLEPKRTLIIVASKTFTTIETMTNARTAIEWLRAGLGVEDIGAHLAAVSTALDKTAQMGIASDRVFGFADWVGGRYSLWGPVGLPIMLAIGPERFAEFLAGGFAMDTHFRTAEPEKNLPVLLALTGIWHRNICDYPTRAVLPYDQRLSRLPAYLQQLDMESNGKSVTLSGQPVSHKTGPVVWGEPGTNGQHAFYQLLHQGTDIIPAEFLIAANGHEPELREHHNLLKANCLAQSEALMIGRSHDEAMEISARLGFDSDERTRQAAHRTFPGNRPSVTLTYDKLTPFALGQIIALYEHRVFVEGVVWGINSFDQWGVELGKELANALLPAVQGQNTPDVSASTIALLRRVGSEPGSGDV